MIKFKDIEDHKNWNTLEMKMKGGPEEINSLGVK